MTVNPDTVKFIIKYDGFVEPGSRFDHWNHYIPTLIIVHVLETYPVTL